LGTDQSLHQAINVLFEDLSVAHVLGDVSVVLLDLHEVGQGQGMDELAPLSVGAVEVLMVLLAELCLVSGGHVLLLL